MGTLFDELEKQARSLSPREKAALARTLIDDLDSTVDGDAEQLWIAEAQRRYEAYQRGELTPVDGEEAITRARSRLK